MSSRVRAFGCIAALALALAGAGCGGNDGEVPDVPDEIPTDPAELPIEPPDEE
jgi:hypothetical protein